MGSAETLRATFHLTHACNLRCGYCFTGEKLHRPMSRDVAERAVSFVLEELARGGRHRLQVVFFGGEPLIELDLLCRIVDRFAELAEPEVEIGYSLSTNGTLLDPEGLRRLLERDVFVSLSVDGGPEVQDAQRPNAAGTGTTEAVERAAALLLAVNPFANVTCVVTPRSARSVGDSVRWLHELGFRNVSVSLDTSAAWTTRELRALEKGYARLARWYEARSRAGEKLYVSSFDERIRTWTAGPVDEVERCGVGTRQFSIAPSGRLYPCVQFVHEDADDAFVIGDVRSGLDEERIAALAVAAGGARDECDGCALVDRCSSWCACANYRSTGTLDAVSPVVCEHERRVMPIADRVARRLWRRRDPVFVHKFYNPAFPVLEYAEEMLRRSGAPEVQREETG